MQQKIITSPHLHPYSMEIDQNEFWGDRFTDHVTASYIYQI